jgi:hypothetical protein
LSAWSKENDNDRQKSDDEGKKEQKWKMGRKKGLLAKSGFKILNGQIIQCAKS